MRVERRAALGPDRDDPRAARPDLLQFEMTLSSTGESNAAATTGVPSSSSAIGPCFISPAA